MKSRRFTKGAVAMEHLRIFCGRNSSKGSSGGLGLPRLHGSGAVNGLANALIRAAAADVAAHGIVDVGVGGLGLLGKESYRGHDLSGLAVTALWNVFFHPGLLHGVAAVGGKSLNGGDFLAGDTGNRGDAGARSFAVDMHGASPAERHAAAEFRAGHV